MNPAIFASLVLTAAVALGACANNERHPQANFELMKRMTYNSVTEGTGTYRQGETHRYTITGTGVVVGDKYLTVDHVVSQYEKVTHIGMTPSRIGYLQRDEQSYLVDGDYRIPLREVIKDRDRDIAVFQIPEEHCAGICNDLAPSDLYAGQPALGTDVMFIGYPAKIGHYYREARFAGMIDKGKQYNGHELPVDAMAIFPSLITGDSGSGLFDRRSGKLMGINYFNIQTLGLVKPIDVYRPYLEPPADLALGDSR